MNADELSAHITKLQENGERIRLDKQVSKEEWHCSRLLIARDLEATRQEMEKLREQWQKEASKCPPHPGARHDFEYKGLANRSVLSHLGVIIGMEQKAHFVCRKGCGEVTFR